MEIFQIVAICFVACIMILLLKKQNPEFAIYISVVLGVLVFLMLIGELRYIINTLKDIANKISLNSAYMKVILKIIAISYISEFGSQICKDIGQSAIATKIEFAGKILILMVSLPVLLTLLETLTKLLR